jgi:hypothetical protein
MTAKERELEWRPEWDKFVIHTIGEVVDRYYNGEGTRQEIVDAMNEKIERITAAMMADLLPGDDLTDIPREEGNQPD